MSFMLIVIPIAVVAIVGLGVLFAYLLKQGKGAKDAMAEGRRLQAELEGRGESDADADAEKPAEDSQP